MKNSFSIELKIMFAAALAVLALVTAVVAKQVFAEDEKEVKFIYNSAVTEEQGLVNNYDIFHEN